MKKGKRVSESIARQMAIRCLMAVEKGSFAEQTLIDLLDHINISTLDRSLLTELVYGVTRNKIRLDNVIDQFLNQPSKKISLLLRSILRIGTYQILYLDRMPIRAAVNEATLQAKRLIGEGVSGLVNAVLRKISDNKNSLNNDPAEDVDELSNYYSHPKWLVSRWVHQYGMLTTKKILLHNNSRASLVLRTNTNKISFVKFVESLKSQDISLSREIPEFDSVEISNLGQSVSSIRGFEEGHFLVQDIASQVVPKLLRIQTRDLVL
ncbi:MAG: transcription antitermination factor NusB, partial [Syntrophaceae bacterium]|nr:transcription antitermination factor NusB [Syntrophaceae bacterium]